MDPVPAPAASTDDPLPGAVPVRPVAVDAAQWVAEAQARRERGETLLALWASDERDREGGYAAHAAYLGGATLSILRLALRGDTPRAPTLKAWHACAERMERAACDLVGVRPLGGGTRPWLRHAAWPEDAHPLRRDYAAAPDDAALDAYPFVRVEGEGVHEIAVGPVHAGIIEPGHFRFSVVGEKVLRLEERLGYVHKGIEKRFEALPAVEGRRLAARVSGDSAVAYSWAYCMALESICGLQPPPRAQALRALALERERLANHLGDLGALGNDAGFAFGLGQFMRLKEDLLRLNAAIAGQRYWLDAIEPGGVAFDLGPGAAAALVAQCATLDAELRRLREIYADHAGVQDRFAACGVLGLELARRLGVLGFAARASGLPADLRCDRVHAPYERLAVQRAVRSEGDVAARVAVRFDEALESLRLCRLLAQALPAGPNRVALPPVPGDAFGCGLVEGWRGPVFIALETGAGGGIRRCHPHDPSWQNWPALEHAVIGNIVPDFPLINKSFNLSYSGHDL